MAKTSYIAIPPEYQKKYWKELKPGSRFQHSRICRNKKFVSRRDKLRLKNQSLFVWFAEYWKELSDAKKAEWKEAADEIGLTNWQCFIHDTAARKRYPEIEGLADPSKMHQGWVGWLHIADPAEEIKITQLHPKFYWIRRRNPDTLRYEPVKITEDFTLPIQIQLNYKSDLTSVAENAFAKFYAKVIYSYQGVNREAEVAVDMDLQSGWQTASAELSEVVGHIIHYDLFFHLKGVQGDLYFDNLKSKHSLQNWVRDPRCDDIDEDFPITWFQIPKKWIAVEVPANTFFKSTYKDFN